MAQSTDAAVLYDTLKCCLENINTDCETGPSISQCQFYRAGTVLSCMVHHGNVIMSSGSPLLDFAQRHMNADRATYSQKNTGTQTRNNYKHTHTELHERCTVPPSGLSTPLQHGYENLM